MSTVLNSVMWNETLHPSAFVYKYVGPVDLTFLKVKRVKSMRQTHTVNIEW